MIKETSGIVVGNTPMQTQSAQPAGRYVTFLGETYYQIVHYDQMPPFARRTDTSSNSRARRFETSSKSRQGE